MIYSLLKKNIGELVIFFLIVLCNWYITQITKFSPAYIGIVLSWVCIIFYIKKHIFFFIKAKFLFLFCFAYFVYLIVDCLITRNETQLEVYIKYFVFNQFLFIITFLYLQFSVFKIKKIIINYFYFSVLIFSLDTVYRIINASTIFTGSLSFYNYKVSGLLFTDSNWTGFMAMLSYSFLIYLRDRGIFYKKRFISVMFIITCLTISRAAIFCCVVITIYSYCIRQKKIIREYLFLFFSLFFLLIMVLAITNLKDGSFISKLGIINGLYYYFNNFPCNTILWGNFPGANGDGITFLNYWVGGHLYLLRFIDYGFFAFFFEFIFLLTINFYTKNKALYIIIPFYIAGFSFAPANLPYMYIYLGLIYYFETIWSLQNNSWIKNSKSTSIRGILKYLIK